MYNIVMIIEPKMRTKLSEFHVLIIHTARARHEFDRSTNDQRIDKGSFYRKMLSVELIYYNLVHVSVCVRLCVCKREKKKEVDIFDNNS